MAVPFWCIQKTISTRVLLSQMIVSLDSVTNSHQDLIMRIRQRGNITLFSCLFLLMMSSWSLVYLKRQARSLSSLKKKIIAYRCVKELNGSSKAHVKKLESLNNNLYTPTPQYLFQTLHYQKPRHWQLRGLSLLWNLSMPHF